MIKPVIDQGVQTRAYPHSFPMKEQKLQQQEVIRVVSMRGDADSNEKESFPTHDNCSSINSTTRSKTSTIAVDSFTSTSTVGEDVNNKNKANLILEKCVKMKRKFCQLNSTSLLSSSSSSPLSSLQVETEKFYLIRVADALRLYARHYTNQNRNRFSFARFGNKRVNSSPNDNNYYNNSITGGQGQGRGREICKNDQDTTPKFVSISLSHVKSYLQHVVMNVNQRTNPSMNLSLSSSSSQNRFTLSQKLNDILSKLCELLPEWISLSSLLNVKRLKSSSSDNTKSSNQTINNNHSTTEESLFMIRIRENISYQLIREKLGMVQRCTGTYLRRRGDNIDQTRNHQEEKKIRNNDYETIFNKCNSEIDLETCINSNTFDSTHQSSVKKRNLNDSNSNVNVNESSTERTTIAINKPIVKQVHTSVVDKESAVVQHHDNSLRNMKGHDCNKQNHNDESDSDDDDDVTSLLKAAGIEQTPKLRMNFNQIMTFADNNGGEVIESTSTSPRDLKMLFLRLNEGKRI